MNFDGSSLARILLVTFYPAYCKANTPKEAARIKAVGGGGEGKGGEERNWEEHKFRLHPGV